MKVYVVSFFNNGERAGSDGVYDVCSSKVLAMKKVNEHMYETEDYLIDFDDDLSITQIYTSLGTYLIERFELDDTTEEGV